MSVAVAVVIGVIVGGIATAAGLFIWFANKFRPFD